MVKECTCLGCEKFERIAKQQMGRNRGDCVPTESYSSRFDQDDCSKACIPKHNDNINERYERDARTSDFYRTRNIPDRFERSSKWIEPFIS